MGWIGICDHNGHAFSLRGLEARGASSGLAELSDDSLLSRGSLIIETRLPAAQRPEPLIHYDRPGDWPFQLSLQAIPCGGVTLSLSQGGTVLQRTVTACDAGRSDLLRITYSWDAPARRGDLSVERLDQNDLVRLAVPAPCPVRLADIRDLLRPGPRRYVAPKVAYIAVSTEIEPVGPMPTLTPDTPIATPQGYRPVSELRRGDTVLTGDGSIVPVLQQVSRTVPARGSFRPVRLRAPYFGLRQGITVAPSQRLVLSGSEVDYMFAQQAVLVEVRHLCGGRSVLPADTGPVVTYCQLVLPEHEAVIAAGALAETLYIGRMRRRKAQLQASLLAGLDRNQLPEHRRSLFPVLKAFDAIALAEQRAI